MTTAELLDRLRRRFPLLLAGLAATAAIAWVVMDRPAVYSTRCDVVLVPPHSLSDGDTGLVSSSENMIALAGLVERRVNDGRRTPSTSQEVDLLGTGVRDGVLVSLPNAGGQWDYDFTAPMLSVQVAGPDPDVVRQRREAAVVDIRTTLHAVQASGGTVTERRMVTTQVVPEAAPVVRRTGHASRAAAGVAVIGGWLSVLAALLADRLLVARARARAPAVPPSRSSGLREPVGAR